VVMGEGYLCGAMVTCKGGHIADGLFLPPEGSRGGVAYSIGLLGEWEVMGIFARFQG
jgi:hypothetical protein